jgi:phage FluMu protein gp41
VVVAVNLETIFELGKIRKLRLDAEEMSAGDFLDLGARSFRGCREH